jgi:NAD(P)-dependent dehydrogenase (short-subunit alcohol dehydrogenase family)
MPVGIVTGASRGLGLALTRALAERGWRLVVDARGADAFERAVAGLERVVAIAGDVADPGHRRALVGAAGDRIDLLVSNAGLLGPSPRPELAAYPLSELARVYEVNAFAPLALVQEALPRLASGAAILHISSDAAVEPYADLPGGVPGRGHLPRAAAGGERPRSARADRGLARERPLPGARARGCCRMSALELPVRLEAHEPPEARGVGRADVAMLVARRHELELVHARFHELPRFLFAGDLLVVNTSATLPAALAEDATIGPLLEARPGVRPPGTWDAFETGVRAVIGQQTTHAEANTIAGRLAKRFGSPVPGLEQLGLARTFPPATALASADLTGLGLTRERACAVGLFANAVAEDAVRLDRSASLDDLIASITALDGLDSWTAHYVALRLGEPDACPITDLALRRALPRHARQAAAPLGDVAERWRPWRALATTHLWLAECALHAPVSRPGAARGAA